jgi:hypothetical protein
MCLPPSLRAIQTFFSTFWIASLSLAMTGNDRPKFVNAGNLPAI